MTTDVCESCHVFCDSLAHRRAVAAAGRAASFYSVRNGLKLTLREHIAHDKRRSDSRTRERLIKVLKMELTKDICRDKASLDQVIDSWFTEKPSVSDEEIEAVVFETPEDDAEETS